MENTTIVKTKEELPDWKKPCPKCGNKYPEPSIKHRKDGTGAWCAGCKWNWKVDIRPDGWDKTAEKLGAKTDYGKEDIYEIMNRFAQRQADFNKNIDERVKRIENMIKNDKVVFYPDEKIDVKDIPF